MRASRAKVAGLQETAAIRRYLGSGELGGLRLRAVARRVEDDSVVGLELLRRKGMTHEVAPLGGDRLQAGGAAHRVRQRIERGAARPPPREPTPAARAPARTCRRPRRDRRRAARREGAPTTSAAMIASASAEACTKAPGGGTRRTPDDFDRRLGERQDRLAVDRQPRDSGRLRGACELRHARGGRNRQRLRARRRARRASQARSPAPAFAAAGAAGGAAAARQAGRRSRAQAPGIPRCR